MEMQRTKNSQGYLEEEIKAWGHKLSDIKMYLQTVRIEEMLYWHMHKYTN